MSGVRQAKVGLAIGDRVLGDDGYLLVVQLARHTVMFETSVGVRREVPYREIKGVAVRDGGAAAVIVALEPWWSGLSAPIRRDALDKLEVVMEILTGYRSGFARFAQPGEPFLNVSDPGFSETRRCEAMARQLAFERESDRQVLRRVANGELQSAGVGASTVQTWIRAWRAEGLRGLVDKRATKGRRGFDQLDERVRQMADDVFVRFDGDISKVNTTTIEADIRLQMKAEGLADVVLPQRLFQEYLSERQRALGRNTRAQRSRHLRRKASAHTSFPAMHPSHIAIDATRADVLVWDELREDARGLWVKGRLLDSVARGREAAALIEAGAIDGLSIGYRTQRAAKNDAGQRVLQTLDLWEVSLVTFPMLPTARIAAKGDFIAIGDVLRGMAGVFDEARRNLKRNGG